MKRILNFGMGLLIMAMFMIGCNCDNSFSTVDEMVMAVTNEVGEISADELKTKLDSGEMVLLVDVREKNEHIYGYIPGSVHICRGTLEFKFTNDEFWDNQFLYPPEKTDEIVLYCKKGKRGILASHSLKKLGYNNVKYLDGGWKEWEKNYPLLYEKNLEEASADHAEEAGGC